MPCIGSEPGASDGIVYGTARGDKERFVDHLHFFMTSAALSLRTSTNPFTKKVGIVMSRARPQTTISFIPTDGDLPLV